MLNSRIKLTLCNKKASILSRMIVGEVQQLSSKFRLTYNMILNLLRVPDFTVEDMIKMSFGEIHAQKEAPEQELQLQRAQALLTDIEDIQCIMGEPDIENYYRLMAQIKLINRELEDILLGLPKVLSAAICPGRVLYISDRCKYNGYVMVIDQSVRGSARYGEKAISISVLMEQQSAFDASPFSVKTIPFTSIMTITATKLKLSPAEASNKAVLVGLASQIKTLNEQKQDLPPVNPIKS